MTDRNWLLDYRYNPEQDYSSEYGRLFGADAGGDYYYSGPNSNWRHALDSRNESRGNSGTKFGYYEQSASNMDRDDFRRMTQRNNILESMMRQGYSMEQLNAHMAGERDVLEEGPERDFSQGNHNWYTGELSDPVTTDQVNSLYQQYLGRDGSEEFLQEWVDSGQSLEKIATSIMGSEEYTAANPNVNIGDGYDPNDTGTNTGGDPAAPRPTPASGPTSNYTNQGGSFIDAYQRGRVPLTPTPASRSGEPVMSAGGMMGGNQRPTFVAPQPGQNGMMGGIQEAGDMARILNNPPQQQQRQMGPAEATYQEVSKPKESVVQSMFKDVMP